MEIREALAKIILKCIFSSNVLSQALIFATGTWVCAVFLTSSIKESHKGNLKGIEKNILSHSTPLNESGNLVVKCGNPQRVQEMAVSVQGVSSWNSRPWFGKGPYIVIISNLLCPALVPARVAPFSCILVKYGAERSQNKNGTVSIPNDFLRAYFSVIH